MFAAARARPHPRRKYHSIRPQISRLACQARKAATLLREQHRPERLQVPSIQCDQIWRNFATLAKFKSSLAMY